jgi:DNA repair protein RadC
MDMDFKVAEVTLQYKPLREKQGKVISSQEAYNILLPTFREGTIEYREYAKVLYLNQQCELVAYNTVSEGGISETPVDVRMIMQGALLTNATQIIFVHNHPSGNLKPSIQDDQLTERLRKACEIMRVNLVDHLIVTSNGYYSYKDMGRI